jgi:hypothetical protein
MKVNINLILIIIGLIILIAGLGISIYLVQRPQDPTSQAATGSACTHSPDCDLLEDPGNSGSYTASRAIAYLDITAKDFHRFNSTNNDGCYNVQINDNQLAWGKIGSGSDCKDISNIQVWFLPPSGSTPTTPPGQPTLTPPAQKEHRVSSCNAVSFSLVNVPKNTPTPPATPTVTVTPVLTYTPTPVATSTPNLSATPTTPPTTPPISSPSVGPTSTPVPTSTPTSTLGENPTSQPQPTSTLTPAPLIGDDLTLPEVGNPMPTYLITGIGVFMLTAALILAIL